MTAVNHWLQAGLWLVWGVCWLGAAAYAKKTIQRESLASRLSHVVPLLVAVWLLAGPGLPGTVLNWRVVHWTPALFWTGTAFVALGLGWTVLARRELGGNWSGVVTLKQDHELIRSGPYRITRHPIYTGVLVALFGSALPNDQWRGALAVLIAALAFWRKIRVEEVFLQTIFPHEYEAYRREVPALLPIPRRFWRRQ